MSAVELLRRVQHFLGVGRTTTPPDDSGFVQTVQTKFSSLSIRDDVPVPFHFGFTACLPVGTDMVVLHCAGDRSSPVAVATNNQSLRPTNLQPGETQIYDAFGKSVYLTKSGGIVINANNSAVTVNNATTVTVNATTVNVNASSAVNIKAPSIKLN